MCGARARLTVIPDICEKPINLSVTQIDTPAAQMAGQLHSLSRCSTIYLGDRQWHICSLLQRATCTQQTQCSHVTNVVVYNNDEDDLGQNHPCIHAAHANLSIYLIHTNCFLGTRLNLETTLQYLVRKFFHWSHSEHKVNGLSLSFLSGLIRHSDLPALD